MTTVTSVNGYSGPIPNKAVMNEIDFANAVYPYLNYFNSGFVVDVENFTSTLNTAHSEIVSSQSSIVSMKDTVSNIYDESKVIEQNINNKYDYIMQYTIPNDATYSEQTIDNMVRMNQILVLTNSI